MFTYLIIGIIFFLLLIYFYGNPYLIENIDNPDDSTDPKYTKVDTNDPLILAKINLANISYLHSRIKDLSHVKDTIVDISNQVVSNSKAIVGVRDAIQKVGYSTVGGEPPKDEPLPIITGVEDIDY